MARKAVPVEERFWRHVQKAGEDECWLWTAALSTTGYGVIGRGSKGQGLVRATHVSWKIHTGTWPIGFMCHRCDNPLCVNPKHLFDGTPKDNTQDAIAKGRNSPPPIRYGSINNKAKLSEEDVRQIRLLLRDLPPRRKGRVAMKTAIAEKFGVGYPAIKHICNGDTWAHLEDSGR